MNQLNRAMLLFTLTLGHAWAAGFEGISNTKLGINAGSAAGDNDFSVFIGVFAGLSNTTGSYNTFLGYGAGEDNTTGGYNTFLGASAGSNNTTGANNTFLGYLAGFSNVTGGNNTFLGWQAGSYNGTGYDNTFLGASAGSYNTTGGNNTFLGVSAGRNNTTGGNNTFLGKNTGYLNTTGSNNTFLGGSAGLSNTFGYDNTFLGDGAGYSNTDGDNNTFLGTSAGQSNTTASFNTFIGRRSGYLTTTGIANTFLGHDAGNNNTTGNANTYLGNAAGFYNLRGYFNVFIGNTAGSYEMGSNRLYIAPTDTATPLIYGEFDNKKVVLNGNLEVIGPDNGLVRLSNTTADNTTKAARMVLKHYNNMSLPVYLFGAVATPGNNFLAFGGGNAIGNAATQLDFFTGPTTTTAVGTSRMTINGTGNIGMGVSSPVHPLQMASGALVTSGGVWTNASSRSYKENIESLSHEEATMTLAALDPVKFNYKVDKENHHVGFIAEDVPELVATKDRKGLSPMDIVAVLTKVTQEQQRAIEEQQKMMREQQQMVHEQQQGMQEQQKIIAELRERNKLISDRMNKIEREIKFH